MTLRRRLVDWSLTGLLVLLPALVLRASLSRASRRRSTPRCCGSPRRSRPACRGSSKASRLWSRYVALI